MRPHPVTCSTRPCTPPSSTRSCHRTSTARRPRSGQRECVPSRSTRPVGLTLHAAQSGPQAQAAGGAGASGLQLQPSMPQLPPQVPPHAQSSPHWHGMAVVDLCTPWANFCWPTRRSAQLGTSGLKASAGPATYPKAPVKSAFALTDRSTSPEACRARPPPTHLRWHSPLSWKAAEARRLRDRCGLDNTQAELQNGPTLHHRWCILGAFAAHHHLHAPFCTSQPRPHLG